MKYERIEKAVFESRPNRFIAIAKGLGETPEQPEKIHVKNTGRCAELLITGTDIYVQKSDNPDRKTKWDLIAVQKEDEIINMDSQIPNKVVQEWLEAGNLIPDITKVKPEYQYGNSRIDLYVEAGGRKILIEVKGVTLKENQVAKFPDAPSERAVKHVEELCKAVKEGYEAYVFFVIQMKGVQKLMPNVDTHPAFAKALGKAKAQGVRLLAYDCRVQMDEITIDRPVPVVLPDESCEKEEEGAPEKQSIKSNANHRLLEGCVEPLVQWFRANKRDLPWRKDISAYHVWVSEIMLQQTRVEAVKPFYARFLQALPTIQDLADAPEDTLLKLWEGLGYYNRVRNMQKAARQVVDNYGGTFPDQYEAIRSLTGIGNYTAGAISSFAFGIAKPAVDGNVLRVVSRLLLSYEDIMKASLRKEMEQLIEKVIPADAPSDFNQGLIELGAIVCVPNGVPKCNECPLSQLCRAHQARKETELPVKGKAKARKIEPKTVLLFKDGENLAIRKRPAKGLLAGLYEFPSLKGACTEEEALEYSRKIGLQPIRIRKLEDAKHIFSHVEWHMTGYEIRVDELEKSCTEKEFLFIHPEEIQKEYPIPAAFAAYTSHVNILLGQEKYNQN